MEVKRSGNVIIGRVVVLETGVGIPDLVVECYDWDVENIDDIVANRISTNITRAPTKSKKTSKTTKSSEIGEAIPTRLFDRLGSVLTQADGRFRLEYDDAAFSIEKDEKRPDLMLIVYAPEDADPSTGVTPHPLERALAISRIPRGDAGRAEAYMIRIDEARLKKFSIRIPSTIKSKDPKKVANGLIDSIKMDVTEAVKASTVGIRQKRKTNFDNAMNKARTAVFGFKGRSALLDGGTTPDSFVEFSADQTILAQRRETATINAISRSLNRIQSEYRPTQLLISLDELDFAKLGSTPPASGLEVSISSEELCHLLTTKRGGPAYERVKDLFARVQEKVQMEERLAKLDGIPLSPSTPSGPAGNSDSNIDSDILRHAVLNQIGDIVNPSISRLATIEQVSENITGVSLPVGPADTTSYFDFHTVQIAFENIWTQAFDERFKDQISTLYSQVVLVEEDTGTSFGLPAELGDIEEVQNVLTSIDEQFSEMEEEVPAVIQRVFHGDIDQRTWNLASYRQQVTLLDLAERYEELNAEAAGIIMAMIFIRDENQRQQMGGELERKNNLLQELYLQGLGIIRSPAGRAGRVFRLMEEIRERLSEPYDFTYFVPNSVNFGIVTTFRQKWEPQAYQVGDLVSSIPLAPNEKRKYSKKITTQFVTKRTRSEATSYSNKSERVQTGRVESDIVQRASQATNFKMTSNGSFNFSFGSIGGTSEFGGNQSTESAKTKKAFRESVVKAAQEYRQEHKLVVESSSEFTSQDTESGEISNPNNELTVTYLFYELQRQYLLTERLHRLTPVILVAQEVPLPHAITESWLLSYEWILRPNLLDKSLADVFGLLTDSFAGSEVSVGILRQNWETQRALVKSLQASVDTLTATRDNIRNQLLAAQAAQGTAEAIDSAGGILKDIVDELSFDPEEASAKLAEVQVDMYNSRLKFLGESLSDSQSRLTRSQDALNRATEEYSAALEEQINKRTKIDQLRIHIKQNILHYMQIIWAHEPDDQRFFRLADIEVTLPTPPSGTVRVRRLSSEEVPIGRRTIDRDGIVYEVLGLDAPTPPTPGTSPKKRLVEIADLDRPIGFKGNYIMFPLKTCTYLTEYMMRDFVDDYFGIRDPDPMGDFDPEELLKYAETVWNDPTISLTSDEKDTIKQAVREGLRYPRRTRDLVVVPSGQLFIEALVGTHPLLEGFKRQHRAFDAGKARAELREMELENLRRVGRMLGIEDGNFEQAEYDKLVKVEGGDSVITDTN